MKLGQGDLVEATRGLIGDRGIVLCTEIESKISNGKVVYFSWVTVSWRGSDAVSKMPINHFRLVSKALEA